MGTGAAFSTKTLGLIVISLGFELLRLKLEKRKEMERKTIDERRDKFFMVDFKD